MLLFFFDALSSTLNAFFFLRRLTNYMRIYYIIDIYQYDILI